MPRTPDEELLRGRQAQSLLANPLLAEAIEAIKERATKAFQRSTAGDKEAREQAYWLYQAICSVENYLTKTEDTGTMRELMDRRRGREVIGGPAGNA